MLNPLVFSPILAIVLSVIPLSVQQNMNADSACTNYLLNNKNNSLSPNILGVGVVNSTLYIVTPNLMVYQVPSDNIDTFAYKIYLNQTFPDMLMHAWPQLYMNQYFTRTMNRLSSVLFYDAVVPKSNTVYTNAAFMTDLETNPSENEVFYNITTNEVFSSQFRFSAPLNCSTGNCKVSFISTDIPEYAYAIKVDAMHNIYITRLQAPGQSSTHPPKFVERFAPICKYSDTQILVTKDSNCSRYQGMAFQKFGYVTGFVYQNQFYLIGPYYVDIFNEAIFNTMDTETPFLVTRIQLSNFFMCNGGFMLVIVIAVAAILILLGICVFCCCREKDDTNVKVTKNKLSKASTSAPAPTAAQAPVPATPVSSSIIQPDPKSTTSPSKTRLGSSSNQRGSSGAVASSITGSNMSNRN